MKEMFKNKEMETEVLNGEMKIVEKKLPIKDFAEGYVNNDNEEIGGVTTMNGNVIIRPKYQRSYIRSDDTKWKQNLIYSIISGYPISLLYFGVNDDGTFDMIDGQQRSITICEFINGGFGIRDKGNPYYFSSLPEEIKEKFLNYELRIIECIGNQSSKLKWFEIINQPISELTKQELRNATYNGVWLEKLKKHFSAPTSKATREVTDKDSRYTALRYKEKPKIERQEILEMVLDWASYSEFPEIKNKDERIKEYMAKHQYDTEISELDFYHKVIDWIWATFLDLDENTHTCRGVKGTPHSMVAPDWGRLYYTYHDKEFDTKYLSQRVVELLKDSDIVKYGGIYEYLLSGEKDQKFLQIRSFSKDDIRKMYNYQGGIDPISGEKHPIEDFEAHHVVAWSDGGKTEIGNLVLLTKESHHKYHNQSVTRDEVVNKRDELWKLNSPKEYQRYEVLKKLSEYI